MLGLSFVACLVLPLGLCTAPCLLKVSSLSCVPMSCPAFFLFFPPSQEYLVFRVFHQVPSCSIIGYSPFFSSFFSSSSRFCFVLFFLTGGVHVPLLQIVYLYGAVLQHADSAVLSFPNQSNSIVIRPFFPLPFLDLLTLARNGFRKPN